MIITDKLVYVHLHKSGGTFVNECLMRFIPGARMLGYHLPSSMIPDNLGHLPLLGFVRSPWSYYVSWYAFQSQMTYPNVLFRVVSKDRALDFHGTLRNLLDLGSDNDMLDKLVALLPKTYGNQGLNLPGFALEPIRGSGKGLYSYLYGYMYGEREAEALVGRVENLRTDLLGFLASIEGALSPPLRTFIEQAEARNTSRHDAFRDYYNKEMAALVTERDQSVVEKFDYRFED
ncbi:MAG TPA: hypothetical protein VFN25_16095 [Dokdonella sp.]|uniref:hypothetical protein n=1 Tax=Dokdonella sp. TaxID=2291710 RepID=UPI002D7F2D10|nr:hypothetical protein [Dokdonella sp.]HET9034413.1 hypothetical protein [Dokdonella sp.]